VDHENEKPISKFVIYKKSSSEELPFSEEDEILRIKNDLGASLFRNRKGKPASGQVSSFTRVGSNQLNSDGSGSNKLEKDSPAKRGDT
jgi:hypothetical protein